MNDSFLYNPFTGELDKEINKLIVSKINLRHIVAQILNEKSIAIEFIGKQGRGKTTHLVHLHQETHSFPMFSLDSKTNIDDLINSTSDVILIDGIHHLSFYQRIQLFKAKRVVVYTTHWNRKMESFLSKKKHVQIKFEGIDYDTLKKIVHKRIQLASQNSLNSVTELPEKELHLLIKKYGDNYRAIINQLFEKYQ